VVGISEIRHNRADIFVLNKLIADASLFHARAASSHFAPIWSTIKKMTLGFVAMSVHAS
jgi:hypothetical protein